MSGKRDRLFGDGGLNGGDRLHDRVSKSPQHGIYRLESPVGLFEKYAGGALVIIVQLDSGARREDSEAKFVGPREKHITFQTVSDALCCDSEWRMGGPPKDGGNRVVLVRIIKAVEFKEVMTFPAREGFRGLDDIFHPLTGCFYSLAGAFEIRPVVAANNEFGAIIFCAAPQVGQFPRDVVEGATEVVNSIAYYQGEGARELLSKFNSDPEDSGIVVMLDHKSVGFRSNKGGELPFDIGHVMIGPLNFLFGTVEHDKSPKDQG